METPGRQAQIYLWGLEINFVTISNLPEFNNVKIHRHTPSA